MINYYNILNLGLAKSKNVITDEMVETAYITKKQQCMEIKNKEKENDNTYSIKTNNEQLIAFEEDDFLNLIEDAYYALRTSNAREHYDELLDMLEEHIQKSKLEKVNIKSTKPKTITNLKQLIENSSKGPEDTNKLLKKIIEDATKKYPIPKCEEESNKDTKDSENEI